MTSTPPPDAAPLRIGFVPGVTLTKWTTTWRDRFRRRPLETVEITEAEQRHALDSGVVDACFVRLPIETDGLHLIRLYDEVSVVWASKDHVVSAVDEVTLGDLADETVLTVADRDSIDAVAMETAVLQVPMSVARGHSRRDLIYRPITDAPETTIGLAWPVEGEHPAMQEFIGVVRGRTPNSSRTVQERAAKRPPKQQPPKSKGAPRQRSRRR